MGVTRRGEDRREEETRREQKGRQGKGNGSGMSFSNAILRGKRPWNRLCDKGWNSYSTGAELEKSFSGRPIRCISFLLSVACFLAAAQQLDVFSLCSDPPVTLWTLSLSSEGFLSHHRERHILLFYHKLKRKTT